MFQKARLKLTAWYLLIIMFISILFSLVIYNGISRELNTIETSQKIKQEREHQGLIPSFEEFRKERERLGLPVPPPLTPANPEMVVEARMRLTTTLVLINFGIFLLAGLAGYFLAGRTLQPIKEMIDEQNRFITDASHELRTPLTALRTEMDVALMDNELSVKEAKKIIESNLEEVINLQGLSERLLALTQSQNKKSSIKKPVLLLKLIKTALKRVGPLARKKKITIDNQVKNYTVAGEPQNLTELLTIILDNAIKYSNQKGQIQLTAKKTDHDVEISIADNGIGISEQDLPHIFDRFYRAEDSRSKEKGPGYGLGLSIAKQIVESHNGSISVTSKVKSGSTFIIKLPLLTT